MFKLIVAVLGTSLSLMMVSAGNDTKKIDTCWKNAYGRGVGTSVSTCAAGLEQDGALCYPQCKNGYKGVGAACLTDCPSGYEDTGALCVKSGST